MPTPEGSAWDPWPPCYATGRNYGMRAKSESSEPWLSMWKHCDAAVNQTTRVLETGAPP